MAVSLAKGGNVLLDKAAADSGVDPATLERVTVQLSWDVRTTDGKPFDLDAKTLVTKAADPANPTPSGQRVLSEQYFVYWHNKVSPGGSVVLDEDNTTGEGDGPDESIDFYLKVPEGNTEVTKSLTDTDATEIPIVVDIYDAVSRGQNFGQVRNAAVKVVANGVVLIEYDLGEDYATETAVVVGMLYRKDTDSPWKFKAIGDGYSAGIKAFLGDYGIDVA